MRRGRWQAAGHDVTVVQLPPRPARAPRRARRLPGRLLRPRPAGCVGCCPSTSTGWPSSWPSCARCGGCAPTSSTRTTRRCSCPVWLGARLTRRAPRLRLARAGHRRAIPGAPLGGVRADGRADRSCRAATAVITVSDGIADRLQRALPARRGDRRSCATSRTLEVRRAVARVCARGSGSATNRSCCTRARRPQAAAARRLCARWPSSRRRTLVFLGDPWPGYAGTLRRWPASAGVADRVHFLPSVPLEELLATRERRRRRRVAARAATATTTGSRCRTRSSSTWRPACPSSTSDLPELRRLVERHGIGWTADAEDPRAVATRSGARLLSGSGCGQRLRTGCAGAQLGARAASAAGLYEQWRPAPRRLAARSCSCATRARTTRACCARRACCVAWASRRASCGVVAPRCASARTVGGRHRDSAADARLAAGQDAHIGARPRRLQAAPRAVSGGGAAALDGRQGAGRRLRAPAGDARLVPPGDRRRPARERPALVHCNDYNTMWIGVAAQVCSGRRVVYDSHELWPDRNLRPEPRRWLLPCECAVRARRRLRWSRRARATQTCSRAATACATARRAQHSRVGGRSCASGLPLMPRWRSTSVRSRATAGLEDAVAALVELPQLRLRIVGPESWGHGRVLRELARRLEVEERRGDRPAGLPRAGE